MLYYRVKKENDNRYYNKKFDFVVGNELYTVKELNKKNIPVIWCDLVNINKNNTYFCFGARFEEIAEV
jgi:hypothetical protein